MPGRNVRLWDIAVENAWLSLDDQRSAAGTDAAARVQTRVGVRGIAVPAQPFQILTDLIISWPAHRPGLAGRYSATLARKYIR